MRFGLRGLLIVFVVAMVGLLAFTWFFVFAKADARRAAMLAVCRQKEEQLANLHRSTAGIADLDAKLVELEQAIRFFDSKLPKAKEIDTILKEIWQMAEANALQTRTIKTLKGERAATYSEQPIQVSLSGRFDGFFKFLKQLEKLPRITRITQMKLERIDQHAGEMQAQMTMSIYFEPDEDAAAVASTR